MDLHRSLGPVQKLMPSTQGPFFRVLGVKIAPNLGETALTVHVALTGQEGQQHRPADFLSHLHLVPHDPCSYWGDHTSAFCSELKDDGELQPFAIVLNGAFNRVLQAMHELAACGMTLTFEPSARRYCLGLPAGSGGGGDGHSGLEVHALQTQADDAFEYAMNQIRHPDSWMWGIHIRPKDGGIGAVENADAMLRFIGFRYEQKCALYGGEPCYWRALFHQSGTEIRERSNAQRCFYAHPTRFCRALEELWNADGVLKGFGFHLFPSSLEHTTEAQTLGDESRLTPESSASGTSLSLSKLHPAVVAAAGPLFASEHYSQAIFEAFKAIEVYVRQRSSLTTSGQKLMAAAFGGEHPPLVITNLTGESGKDEQEGFKFLFMGAMAGIRNPNGHDFVKIPERDRALEYLAFASLLLYRLDLATST